MNAVNDFKAKINGIENDQAFIDLIKDTMNTIKAQESEQWWKEQGDKLDNAKKAVLGNLQAAKDRTAEKYNAASQAISEWFEEMKNKMSVAWGEFKKDAGQKFENFKQAMQQFGEKIAEMWGKAMESLGKLFDEIEIGAHDFAVDAKTVMQNICTDMYYGAANLGVAMQKGVLAMDDAFQSAKGTVSQAVAYQFDKSAGQLLVESELAAQNILDTSQKFNEMDFSGQDPKTIRSAEEYQETVMQKMDQEQAKLTEKIQSRESWRETFQNIKDESGHKMDANRNDRNNLNAKAELNTGKRQAIKTDRSHKASEQKSSYAEKVRQARQSASNVKVR